MWPLQNKYLSNEWNEWMNELWNELGLCLFLKPTFLFLIESLTLHRKPKIKSLKGQTEWVLFIESGTYLKEIYFPSTKVYCWKIWKVVIFATEQKGYRSW